ncbi:MAG: 4'-phosphopantetheinyl transferase superfamily protein [Bryobacteraceae bacterium]|jgi:4'-phosphopantetheinyl transferase
MNILWFEQSSANLPARDDWLSADDVARLSGMRFAKRRDDWRLGRWTAKRAVSTYLELPADSPSLARIEIRPEPGGAPEVFIGNDPAPVRISISHREGLAACAVAGPHITPGCDLEIIEPRSAAFATDYFTAAEQEVAARGSAADRWRILALLWSAKESVLKALRIGLRLDTRCVVVDALGGLAACGDEWRPLRAHCRQQVFEGCWRQTGNVVRTLVSR